MPAEKNMTLRVVVPIIVTIAAVAVGIAFFINATGQGSGASSNKPADAQPAATPADEQSKDDANADQPTDSGTQPDAPPNPAPTEPVRDDQPAIEPAEKPASTAPIAALHARPVPIQDETLVLGSLDETSPYRLRVELTTIGAGIQRIESSRYYKTIRHKDHYLIQQRQNSADGSRAAIPMSVTGMMVNGQWVPLFNTDTPEATRLWRIASQTDTRIAFEAIIENESNDPVMRLVRQFTLSEGSFDLRIDLLAENLTDAPLELSFIQTGPVALPEDRGGYRIPLERVRFGALLDPKRDPSREIVEGDRKLLSMSKALTMSEPKFDKQGNPLPPETVWPNANIYDGFSDLVWLAQSSRYFSAIAHAMPEEGQDKALWATARVYPKSLVFYRTDNKGRSIAYPDALHLEMQSRALTAEPGQTLNLPMGFYAGPTSERYLAGSENPVYARTAMDSIVIYQLSFGLCAMCTFQWLADLLHAFLSILHKYVVFDWALAIMVLVVCVRTILHPITKKSQISMMRFSKQMQALAPKQKAIQEKYKDDRVKMQQEMTRLMREEGVNYAGMLGCIPMFLQTPVWIALYAMLYTVFELRHEPAFFGAVQAVFPNWSFLGDLSVGDHFIDFGHSLFTVPMMGDITGINILPVLLGVVFYMQQKYMTPPPSAQLTPEQQSQQKMMKIMMIVMFPVFMYNAPAALAIYFITNSTLGILESRYIRSHVDQDALVPDKPKHAGLGRKKVANKARSPFQRTEEPRKRYKDRQ
ncbi:MAG: membrane protein insertase YidC [Phycisphaerales bacterium]